MNSSKQFQSEIKKVGRFAISVSNDSIKTEPMFFNASPKFAYEKGGLITKSFLNNLPDNWINSDLVFDSRVHMLMPGWYPAIPGWHHDDVPRPSIPVGQHFITAGQPDYDNPRYKSEHILGLVNADICPTEFAIGNCTMPKIEEGQLIYREWHKEIEDLLAHDMLSLVQAQDRTLYQFDWQTFHSGRQAISHGWRWFGRVSRNTDRTKEITNEIRSQVQVYLEFPTEGW